MIHFNSNNFIYPGGKLLKLLLTMPGNLLNLNKSQSIKTLRIELPFKLNISANDLLTSEGAHYHDSVAYDSRCQL